MSILEHIAELRDRLLRCVLALVVTTTVAFAVLYEPVLSFVTKSYCTIPAKYRLATAGGGCRLLALGPLDPLGIRIRVAVTVGLVLAMPLIAYQLWRFITPGLRRNEKRYAVPFALASTILFAMAIPMWIFYFAAAGVARWVIEPARARRRAQLEQGS